MKNAGKLLHIKILDFFGNYVKGEQTKSLRKGVWGGTLLQKGSPQGLSGSSYQNGERKLNGSKIKSAISRKVNKNKQSNKSAKLSGNKEIADFIAREELSERSSDRRYFVQERRKRQPDKKS